MTNSISKVPMKQLVHSDKVQQMLQDTLQDKASQFATSIVSVVNSNQDLQKVDQISVINSAMVAATLDLPINQSLGYMWLVPYGGKATPQIGYKGYIQLAMRTGQYKAMNAVTVHEGELGGWNALTEEIKYTPENKKSDVVIGYIGFFKLLNGFEKTVYWSKEAIDEHRKRFSKMSGKDKPSGVWASDFDAMALKTVLRNMLSKWGPMSTQMETALSKDEQAPAATEIEADEISTASETDQQMMDEFLMSQQGDELNGKAIDTDGKSESNKAD